MSVPDLVRMVDEFVFALRSAGVACSVEQLIVAARGLAFVGLTDREQVRTTLLSCLASSADERAVASRVFDEFFLSHTRARSLDQALRFAGLADAADLVRTWLESERVVDDETELAYLSEVALRKGSGPAAKVTHDVTNKARLSHAQHRLGTLRVALRGALAAEAAERAFDVVNAFLRQTTHRIRDQVSARLESLEGGNHEAAVPLSAVALDRLLRQAASQLRCRLRRRQRAARGRSIDSRRLLRDQARTHGVPQRIPRSRNRRKAPAFFFLCDVSESTRPIAELLLKFIGRASYFFKCSRCYVFASTTAAVTLALSEAKSAQRIVHDAGVGQISNYGAAIRGFMTLARPYLDRRSVVVLLGDGRANFRDPGLLELAALRKRVGDLVWLCSEEPVRWSADSLMHRYLMVASRNGQLASPNDVAASAWLLGSLR